MCTQVDLSGGTVLSHAQHRCKPRSCQPLLEQKHSMSVGDLEVAARTLDGWISEGVLTGALNNVPEDVVPPDARLDLSHQGLVPCGAFRGPVGSYMTGTEVPLIIHPYRAVTGFIVGGCGPACTSDITKLGLWFFWQAWETGMQKLWIACEQSIGCAGQPERHVCRGDRRCRRSVLAAAEQAT